MQRNQLEIRFWLVLLVQVMVIEAVKVEGLVRSLTIGLLVLVLLQSSANGAWYSQMKCLLLSAGTNFQFE